MQKSSLPPLEALLASVRTCTLCDNLPLGPRPILQAHSGSRILIAGQAPGRKAHEKGKVFDDPSGRRLRDWLGVTEEEFYNPEFFATLPMAFCFPGTGKGGDLPPRPECAPAWREQLLSRLSGVRLTLVIGTYAQHWHLPDARNMSLTETVKNWRTYWPEILPMPHPSPRNRHWLGNNPFFEEEILPALRGRVAELIKDG